MANILKIHYMNWLQKYIKTTTDISLIRHVYCFMFNRLFKVINVAPVAHNS